MMLFAKKCTAYVWERNGYSVICYRWACLLTAMRLYETCDLIKWMYEILYIGMFRITCVLPVVVSPGSMGPYDPAKVLVDLGMGVLGCLDTKGVWRQYRDSVDISNGLAWTRDARTMFFIDTYQRKVYAFDFNNENGTICKSWSLDMM